jgi:hypothetical protein
MKLALARRVRLEYNHRRPQSGLISITRILSFTLVLKSGGAQ